MAAKELEIGFPEMRYDITMPFFEGRVKIDGITFKPAKISSMYEQGMIRSEPSYREIFAEPTLEH